MRAEPLSRRFRLLGLLPLAFFLAQAVRYWRIDQLGHLLWMCNISNVLLAFGLFFDQRVLIRVAVIWSIPGLVIWWRYVFAEWFHYATVDWAAVASSTTLHVGGLIVGLLVLRRVRVDRRSWLFSFGWYIAVQAISRITTAVELNVNVSHDIYPGWQGAFNSYWRFWLVLTVVIAGSLWALTWLLNRLWPTP